MKEDKKKLKTYEISLREPYEGNPHVRFDEGKKAERLSFYSTG